MIKKKEFKIPKDAKKLEELNFKKFKKKNEDYYNSKKDLKHAYFSEIIDYLPDTIILLVRYGHLNEVKNTKNEIYNKITDKDFIKYLLKEIKNNDLEFDNMGYFPVVIYDIINVAKKTINDMKMDNPDDKTEFDMTDLIELSRYILKKKIKKFDKAGIDKDMAFDILSIIPNTDILKRSQYFRIRSLFNVLYEHAKTKIVNFE